MNSVGDQGVSPTPGIVRSESVEGVIYEYRTFETFYDAVSVTTTKTTASGFSERVTDIPPPPNIPRGSKEVECPYCFTMLLTKDLSGSRWKTHFLRDVEPYFCLSTDCSEQWVEFGHRQAWITHMRRQHSPKSWRCFLCSKTGEAAEDCTSHLKEEHAMDDAQSLKTTTAMTRQGPVYESCPFCGFEGDKDVMSVEIFNGGKRLEEKKVMEGNLTMLNHIAGHLEVIALIALPYPKEEERRQGTATYSLPTNDRSVQSSTLSWGSEEKDSVEPTEIRDRDEWGFMGLYERHQGPYHVVIHVPRSLGLGRIS
ncbi:hypothetical protein P154DRAFT_617341 [Amniculicola lignicola CBS 123094]|uniref:Oxidoreductase acuF-like C2H2 type zinc-finger domain-containing protein n=1 Tax=Amniculicola lignicola CBS 123094 TaxID=1392246 RepID=A0A6A5WYE6_9PLEO|nr:hypothetical protein P154DRAFT_617341 [Amniculicola lignicola CBS 123094]